MHCTPSPFRTPEKFNSFDSPETAVTSRIMEAGVRSGFDLILSRYPVLSLSLTQD